MLLAQCCTGTACTDGSQGSPLAGCTFSGHSPGAVVMHSRTLQTLDSWVVLPLGHWGPVLVREGEKIQMRQNEFASLPKPRTAAQLMDAEWHLTGPLGQSSGWQCSWACVPWGPSTQQWKRVFTQTIAGAFRLHSSESLGPTDESPLVCLMAFFRSFNFCHHRPNEGKVTYLFVSQTHGMTKP